MEGHGTGREGVGEVSGRQQEGDMSRSHVSRSDSNVIRQSATTNIKRTDRFLYSFVGTNAVEPRDIRFQALISKAVISSGMT